MFVEYEKNANPVTEMENMAKAVAKAVAETGIIPKDVKMMPLPFGDVNWVYIDEVM